MPEFAVRLVTDTDGDHYDTDETFPEFVTAKDADAAVTAAFTALEGEVYEVREMSAPKLLRVKARKVRVTTTLEEVEA